MIQPRRSPPGAGFTLVEMLIVISIIALLVALLLPSLGKARAAAQRVKCLAQLGQIGVVQHTYAQDNAGWFIAKSSQYLETVHSTYASPLWNGPDIRPILLQYGRSTALYYCPVVPSDTPYAYFYPTGWTSYTPPDQQTFARYLSNGADVWRISYSMHAGYFDKYGFNYRHPNGTPYRFPVRADQSASTEPLARDWLDSLPFQTGVGGISHGTTTQPFRQNHSLRDASTVYADGHALNRSAFKARLISHSGGSTIYHFW